MPGESIREVVINVHVRTGDVDLKVPEISDLETSTKSFTDTIAQSNEQLDAHFKSTEISIESLAERMVRQQRVQQRGTDTQLASRRAVLQTTDAVTQLARGIAFLTVSSEDDLGKVVRALLKFEGIFGIFRGGVAVMNSATVAFRTTSAANAALATSNTAVAVTGSAAATAMGALQVAMGPLSIVFLAIGASIALAAAALELFSDDADVAREKAAATAAGVRALAPSMQRVQTDLNQTRQRAVARESLLTTELAEQLKILKEQERILRSAELATQSQKHIQQIALATSDTFSVDDVLARGTAFDELQLETLREMSRLKREALGIEQQRGVLVRTALNDEQQILETQRRALSTAQSRLDAENGRLKSLDAQLGSLDELTRRRVLNVGERASRGGDLSRGDEALLARTGIGTGLLEDIRSERGREAREGRDLSALDFGDVQAQVNLAQSALDEKIRQSGTQESINANLLEIEQKLARQLENQNETMEGIIELLNGFERATSRARANLEQGRHR